MENNILYIIAFISLICYGYNVLADLSTYRPLSAHFGYGSISVISIWNLIPTLAIIILVIFLMYSVLILSIWIEEKRQEKEKQWLN